jgi:endonuclease/exonuclease/phosphatase family metal-dependent hydrolase
MKSNIRSGNSDTAIHRGEEAASLCKNLEAVREHFRGKQDLERDIIILGDMNTLHHTEATVTAYEANGFVDLNDKDQVTWDSSSYSPAPFDRILVPAAQKEFATRSFSVVTNGFEESLSDHHMVVTEITVLPDDD